jgi:hypothetical protein
MSNNTLSVKVSSRTNDQGETSFEGTVSIQGLKPTKLVKKSDGASQFPTKSALSGAARNLAKSLGFSDVEMSDNSSKSAKSAKSAKSNPTNSVTKVAAKASAKSQLKTQA